MINSHTSPLSSLDNRYTFLFLSTNSFFISIAWSCNFFVSILSLVFFPKIWNYLWNFWGTNFLASSLDFAAYYSLSQIFYSSAIFFTSIFLSLLGFLLIFLIFLIFFFFFLSFFFFLFLLLQFCLSLSLLLSIFLQTPHHLYFSYPPVNFRIVAS